MNTNKDRLHPTDYDSLVEFTTRLLRSIQHYDHHWEDRKDFYLTIAKVIEKKCIDSWVDPQSFFEDDLKRIKEKSSPVLKEILNIKKEVSKNTDLLLGNKNYQLIQTMAKEAIEHNIELNSEIDCHNYAVTYWEWKTPTNINKIWEILFKEYKKQRDVKAQALAIDFFKSWEEKSQVNFTKWIKEKASIENERKSKIYAKCLDCYYTIEDLFKNNDFRIAA